MNQQEILQKIVEERKYQDEKWGTAFDDKNSINDWVTYITQYAGGAGKMKLSTEEQEKQLLKVATLAVAALESSHRNNGFPKRHYD